jgi:F0F1-type ATP synthase assembly protein I
MKGFEKEKNKTPNPLWVKVRFYVLILGSTALLLTLLLSLSHGEKNAETLIPAGISLANAILAYLVSKREQGKRSYKQLMKNLRTWTIARFVVMAVLLVVFILTKVVEPLPFIFTFIGFYILHQVIEITVMQKELK